MRHIDSANGDGDAFVVVVDGPFDESRTDCKGCTEEELAYLDVAAVAAAVVVAGAVFACKHS